MITDTTYTQRITLLDKSRWELSHIIEKAKDDSFYYGYLGQVAFSSTILSKVLESPKTYWYYLKYGDQNNGAYTLGKLVHCLALTPELFDSSFEVVDVQSKTTKLWKEARPTEGRHLITSKELSDANRVVRQLQGNEYFNQALFNAECEIPAIGTIMGYPVRAKADILQTRGNQKYLFDLKTTNDIGAFTWKAKNAYNYDLQVYIYCTLFNVSFDKFKFIIIDKGSLDIAVADVTEEFWESGRAKFERAIKTYFNFFEGKTPQEVEDGLQNYYISLEL